MGGLCPTGEERLQQESDVQDDQPQYKAKKGEGIDTSDKKEEEKPLKEATPPVEEDN